MGFIKALFTGIILNNLIKPLDKQPLISDNINMNKIRYTKVYRLWYRGLDDIRAKARIDIRLNSVKKGSFGVQRSVGDGIFELKIDYGPGYRLYYKKVQNNIVVLLCGGDKSVQEDDIEKAKKILKELKNENL
jgi:putative addiction module killer protein